MKTLFKKLMVLLGFKPNGEKTDVTKENNITSQKEFFIQNTLNNFLKSYSGVVHIIVDNSGSMVGTYENLLDIISKNISNKYIVSKTLVNDGGGDMNQEFLNTVELKDAQNKTVFITDGWCVPLDFNKFKDVLIVSSDVKCELLPNIKQVKQITLQ